MEGGTKGGFGGCDKMYRTAGSRYQDLQSALDTSQVCAAVGSSLHAAIGNLDINGWFVKDRPAGQWVCMKSVLGRVGFSFAAGLLGGRVRHRRPTGARVRIATG